MTDLQTAEIREISHEMGFLESRPTGIYTKVKLTSYSNGLGECVYTKLNSNDHEFLGRKKGKKNDESLQEATAKEKVTKRFILDDIQAADAERENKDRSLRRAKSTVRKKIIEGELDHLMTLTYQANMSDEKQGWKDFSRFIRKVRVKYPNLKYVVVMEKQKRGAVHFHLAVHGYFHAITIRNCWKDVIGNGNIDLQRKKHNQKLTRLASYLSKYLSKQQKENARFSNLFRSSQNIKLNETHFYLPADYWADNRISRLFSMLHGLILSRWDSGNQGAFHSKFIASY